MPKVVGQDQAVYKRTTCRHCGAINEYAPNEIRDIKTNHDFSGIMMCTKDSIARVVAKKFS